MSEERASQETMSTAYTPSNEEMENESARTHHFYTFTNAEISTHDQDTETSEQCSLPKGICDDCVVRVHQWNLERRILEEADEDRDFCQSKEEISIKETRKKRSVSHHIVKFLVQLLLCVTVVQLVVSVQGLALPTVSMDTNQLDLDLERFQQKREIENYVRATGHHPAPLEKPQVIEMDWPEQKAMIAERLENKSMDFSYIQQSPTATKASRRTSIPNNQSTLSLVRLMDNITHIVYPPELTPHSF